MQVTRHLRLELSSQQQVFIFFELPKCDEDNLMEAKDALQNSEHLHIHMHSLTVDFRGLVPHETLNSYCESRSESLIRVFSVQMPHLVQGGAHWVKTKTIMVGWRIAKVEVISLTTSVHLSPRAARV